MLAKINLSVVVNRCWAWQAYLSQRFVLHQLGKSCLPLILDWMMQETKTRCVLALLLDCITFKALLQSSFETLLTS